jgi:hypothetical protein
VRSRWAALSLAWAWIAVNTSVAVAQESASASGGRVQLKVEGCPAVATAVVRRVLSIEVGDLLLDDSDDEAGDAERLTIRCAGNFAFVESHGPSGEPPTERMFRLDDFPGDAAPRALALLGVELLAARSAAVRERILRLQTGAAPVIQSVAPQPIPRPPGPVHREMRIGAAGVSRVFVQQAGASALGGRVEASSTAMRCGVFSGDAEVAVGSKDVSGIGQTTALLISGGVTFGLFAGRRHWRTALGLGGRIGLVRESGSSADPAHVSGSTFVRPWGGPMLNANLSGTLGRLALTMGGEAGWSLFSIAEVAGGATAIAVRGPWIALSIGADLRR